ncbi:MAG: hypothetical protein HY614_01510 [Candidatus Rokubacteria bacterium]|nr:hypothetical protein [Candidatus Rokubacteria bacterium]
MDLLRRPWGRGAVIGLMVAAVVLAALGIELEDESRLKFALQFLAAIPPFLYSPLLRAPEPLLWALLAAWWGGVGALVGWAIARGVDGRIGAALLVTVLLVAHRQTLASIERGLSGAAAAMSRIFRAMFAP